MGGDKKDDKKKDNNGDYTIALAIFIFFTAFTYIKPGLTIMPYLFLLIGLYTIYTLAMGIIKGIKEKNPEKFLYGIGLIALITLLIPNGTTLLNTLFKIIGL